MTVMLVGSMFGLAHAQTLEEVQDSVIYVNEFFPANQLKTYRLTVTNNNTTANFVRQIHPLMTTPDKLTGLTAPAGWVWAKVPWDAFPDAALASTTGTGIAPNGGTGVFTYQCDPPNDFYVRSQIRQGTISNNFVDRQRVLPRIPHLARDYISKLSVRTRSQRTDVIRLEYTVDSAERITRHRLTTINADRQPVDHVRWPPANMNQANFPPDRFFSSSVPRNIDTAGQITVQNWFLRFETAQFSGGGMSLPQLEWVSSTVRESKAKLSIEFEPSVDRPGVGRSAVFRLRNDDTRIVVIDQLQLFFHQPTDLPFDAIEDWTTWDRTVGPFQLTPGQVRTELFQMAPGQYIIGRVVARELGSSIPIMLHFLQEEIGNPLVCGSTPDNERPINVTFRRVGTTEDIVLPAQLLGDERWQVPIELISLDIRGSYYVRAKPDRALSVLGQRWRGGTPVFDLFMPGGDAVDPDIRIQHLILGDVDNNDIIDDTDLARVLGRFGAIGNLAEDLNGDGIVDDIDLAILLENFGRSGPPWP